MKLGICTIQRDRALWLPEWFAFHYLVGFRKFYFYAHNCCDNTPAVIETLQKHFDITSFAISPSVDKPQLVCYQHAYASFGHEVDWMAFIDGDEFLFPVEANSIQEVLEEFDYERISALAAYWALFGSSGHVTEPEGLIIDNYRYRMTLDFHFNRHIKSIVRGRQGEFATIGPNAHMFNTIMGTYDELLRPVTYGLTKYEPSHRKIRINHYTLQSWEYFKKYKQIAGAADAGRNRIIPDSFFFEHDRQDEYDTTMDRFIPAVRDLIRACA